MEKNKNTSFLDRLIGPITSVKVFGIIVFLGLVFFINSLFGEFVGDDIFQIVSNTYVHSLNYIWSFFVTPTDLGSMFVRFYRPMMFSSFAALYTLFGMNVIPYHFLQLCLHILNSFLLYLLFKNFFNKKISIFLSLVFLLHPINVENVDLIADLQEVLFLFFGLLAVYFVNIKKNTTIKTIVIGIILIIFALLSKETAILFIPVIILFDYLFKRTELKLPILISVFSLSFYAVMRLVVAKIHFVYSSAPFALILKTTFFTLPKMFYFYIANFFFPNDLAIRHAWLVHAPSFNEFYLPLIIDLIFLFFVIDTGIYIFRKKKEQFKLYLFFLIWFILGMAPTLQLWGLDVTVAERWFYFPLIGLLGLVGIKFSNLNIQGRKIHALLEIAALIILLCLGVRTFIRNVDWQTRINLYKHDFEVTNDLVTGYALESEYIYNAKFDEAKKLLPTLEKMSPGNPTNVSYKAVIELHDGDKTAAEKDFTFLLTTKYDGLAYQALPKLLYDKGDYKGAEELLKKGVSIYPMDQVLWRNLAYVEYKLGNLKDANEAAQKINMTLQQIVGQ